MFQTQRKQLVVFAVMLVVYALIAFVSYVFMFDQMTAGANVPVDLKGMSLVTIGLANAGIILVGYGLLGLAGFWLARKLNLPGIFSEDGNWNRWVWIPLIIGAASGLVLIIFDNVFAPINGFGHLTHPPFPFSILASMSAGIGEEILFRVFFFGLWAIILNWILKRFNGQMAALWIANVIAAVAFSASHMSTLMILTGASSPSQLNPMLLLEILLLNSFVGILAGWRYMKDGLVAASGIHFWADIVWHVVWGLFS